MEKLFKNFIWMAAANVVSSLFSVILFIYLARVLMPEALGYLSYTFTIIFFLANFIDLGLSTYGAREIAKDRARTSEYASEIVSFRLVIAFVLAVAFVILALFYRLSILKILIIESSLMLFTFGFATEWAFQGMEKMHMVFISSATTAILQVSLIFGFVKGPGDLLNVPLLYFIATLPIVLIFLRRLNFRLKMENVDFKRMKLYLSSSLVIWSISLFAQVYNNLDILILGFFRKIDEVGYYTITRRFIDGAALFMVFLSNALFPLLSRTFNKDMHQFKEATNKFLKIGILLAVVLFLPVMFLGKAVISITVGSEYIPAVIPLRIMFFGFVLVILNLPYSTGLIASGFEKEVLKQAVASAAVSVASNLMLIPRYGMVGASISFVLAEAVALAWILHIYNSKIKCLIKT